MSEDIIQIEEAKRIIRVTSKGDRIRRLKCRAGFKLDGDRCVPITGSERQTKRLAIRKAVRTKKMDVQGKRRAVRKRLKAMRKRKAYGL